MAVTTPVQYMWRVEDICSWSKYSSGEIHGMCRTAILISYSGAHSSCRVRSHSPGAGGVRVHAARRIARRRELGLRVPGEPTPAEESHSANTSCSVLNVAVSVFAETTPSFFASRVLSTART